MRWRFFNFTSLLGLFCLSAFCRLSPDITDANFSKQGSFRCGVYVSHIYENNREEEVYADLGLLLQNQEIVQFSNTKRKKITKLAKKCDYLCGLDKEIIYLKQEALKKKIKSNQIKGDLTKVAKELNEIHLLKKKWLLSHSQRYKIGVSILNGEELSHWIFIEQNVRPFLD